MKENVEVVHVDVDTVSRWWSRGLRVVFRFLGVRESQGVCARRLAQQRISRVTSSSCGGGRKNKDRGHEIFAS